MATITTTFRLIDNVTPQLKTINNNLGVTVTKLLGITAVMRIFNTLSNVARKVASEINNLSDIYSAQYEQEVKLYTIGRERMNLTLDQMEALKLTAKQIQQNGIFNDQMILQGMQEIATFVQTKEQIEALAPAIANLTAQQYGYSASGDNMRQVATLIGRLLNGNTNGLNKLNLAFTENEKKLLKHGDLNAKIAMLIDKVTSKTGQMNEALAQTKEGKIKQVENNIRDLNEQLGKSIQPFKLWALTMKQNLLYAFIEKLDKGITWVKEHFDALAKGFIVFAGTAITWIGALVGVWVVLHWKIALVLALIVVFNVALANASSSGSDALGNIIGSLTLVANIIVGLVKIVVNVVNVIYNAIGWLINAVIGLFTNNFVGWFKNFIGGIAEIVLGLVGVITSVLDFLFGTKMTESIRNAQKSIDEWANKNAGSVPTHYTSSVAGFNGLGESWEEGYNFGSNAYSTANDSWDEIMALVDKYPTLKTNGSGAIAVYDESLIDIADDYRELLTRRAVEKFNLQFMRMSPSINIDRVDVHKEADAENVLETITDTLENIANSNLREVAR